MARTDLTSSVHTLLGAYPTLPITANAADVTMTAGDVANLNQFTLAKGDILLAHNTGVSAYTITITSEPDPYGRNGDITTYSIGAGEIAAFGEFELQGWRQSDGKLYLNVSNAAVTLGVLRKSA